MNATGPVVVRYNSANGLSVRPKPCIPPTGPAFSHRKPQAYRGVRGQGLHRRPELDAAFVLASSALPPTTHGAHVDDHYAPGVSPICLRRRGTEVDIFTGGGRTAPASSTGPFLCICMRRPHTCLASSLWGWSSITSGAWPLLRVFRFSQTQSLT
jgi:hypothetical protein